MGKTATVVVHESHQLEGSFTNVWKGNKTLVNLFFFFHLNIPVLLLTARPSNIDSSIRYCKPRLTGVPHLRRPPGRGADGGQPAPP